MGNSDVTPTRLGSCPRAMCKTTPLIPALCVLPTGDQPRLPQLWGQTRSEAPCWRRSRPESPGREGRNVNRRGQRTQEIALSNWFFSPLISCCWIPVLKTWIHIIFSLGISTLRSILYKWWIFYTFKKRNRENILFDLQFVDCVFLSLTCPWFVGLSSYLDNLKEENVSDLSVYLYIHRRRKQLVYFLGRLVLSFGEACQT